MEAQLKGKHMRMVSKMVFKMDIQVNPTKDMSQNAFGFSIVLEIIKRLHLASNELNELLSDILAVEVEDVEDMDFGEMAGALRTVVMAVINFINPPKPKKGKLSIRK